MPLGVARAGRMGPRQCRGPGLSGHGLCGQQLVCSRKGSPACWDQMAARGQQRAARTPAEGEAALDPQPSAECSHLLYLMLSSE